MKTNPFEGKWLTAALLGVALLTGCQQKREDIALWELEQSRIELQESLKLAEYRLQVHHGGKLDELNALTTALAGISGKKQNLQIQRTALVEDVASLKIEADYCWTDELQRAWHALEAAALTQAWESSGDPWNVVNASGHWRKAGEPEQALRLTEAALARCGSNSKLMSALATTRGGAMRDLRRLDEAKALASEAHELTSSDYRPCTLLGAVYIELGDLPTGHEWYAKAESLGASRQAIDHELRSLLMRTSIQEQQRIREFLLRQDPERFAWLRRWPGDDPSSANSKSAQAAKSKDRSAFAEAGRHDHRSR